MESGSIVGIVEDIYPIIFSLWDAAYDFMRDTVRAPPIKVYDIPHITIRGLYEVALLGP